MLIKSSGRQVSQPESQDPKAMTENALMDQEAIFGPFLALQLLTMMVWFYMYSKRIPFLLGYIQKHKEEGLTMEEIANPQSRHYFPKIPVPAAVVNPSDNLKNLFEIPVVFYALLAYLYMTKTVDDVYVRAAWVFVAFRYLHSAIHATFNHVTSRFYCYIASSMAFWFMLVRASILYFGKA